MTAPPAAPPTAPVASAAPASPPSPFTVIGEIGNQDQLFPAGDRGFVLSQAGVELELVGDEVVQDPMLRRGIPETVFITVEAIAGRWPDSLWLSTTEASGRSGFSTVWSWDGKTWSRKQRTNEGYFMSGVQAWSSGRMLTLQQAGMAFDASFLLLSGPRGPLPQFSKPPQMDPFQSCRTRLRVDMWHAFTSGELVALGGRCDIEDQNFPPAVERWAARAKQGTLETLPFASLTPQASWTNIGLGALAPNDIFVTAAGETSADGHTTRTEYFAHFDGKSWQTLPSPIPDGIGALWTESDGVLFASNDNQQLWSRSPQGDWAHVPWPEQLTSQGSVTLEGVWPRGPGDVWAVLSMSLSGEGHRYLLHTRPAPHAIPTPEARDAKEREYHLPGPPVDWCTTPFVLLYTLGRNAPADYDYPATRAALKGHGEFEEMKFVEFERDARRFFGARVPDFQIGKKLAQLVKDKVPGSTPQLVCHDPAETRQLDIDLKTGQLRH